MRKLNIVAANQNKLVEITLYDSLTKSDKLYTLTDGKGNYALTHGGVIWWADKDNKSVLIRDDKVDGNPKKSSSSEYSVAKVNDKLGIYDLDTLDMVVGPYKSMDLIEGDVFGRGHLPSKVRDNLTFEK